jgi:5-methylcytosine-specific restriction protein A
VRELTVESATLLNEIIQVTEDVPRTKRAITISIRLLREYRRQRELAPAFCEENRRGTDYSEGSLKSVLVNRYERDPEARRLCIRHHGTQCSVCGFDFGHVYGEFADGFIHVHHLTPISSIGRGYRVNPAQDLRPLCPNCHAVTHLRTPPYSIEELRELISSPH